MDTVGMGAVLRRVRRETRRRRIRRVQTDVSWQAEDPQGNPVTFASKAEAMRARPDLFAAKSVATPLMLDRALKGLIGTVHSGGIALLPEATGNAFSDHLIQKRREGRL